MSCVVLGRWQLFVLAVPGRSLCDQILWSWQSRKTNSHQGSLFLRAGFSPMRIKEGGRRNPDCKAPSMEPLVVDHS
ncbi:hypothetical protein EDD21DRAFT_372752 [Dissophora ornata]|nr:hypothetical protein EDD21DRAFT_372752 [Dissophora ornata]